MDDKNLFQTQESILLDTFIKDFLGFDVFDPYIRDKSDEPCTYHYPTKGIELIIRPECNQKCEYCYIAKRGHELYPDYSRVSNEQIIKNLRTLFNYFINEKRIIFRRIDLFAGDLFYDDLFFDVCDVLYEFYSKLYAINSFDFKNNIYSIVMPCNCSFVADDKKAARFEEYREKFNNICMDLGISWSTDGPYSIDTREQRALDDNYFDKIFAFCQRNHFGAHPMTSPSNVAHAIENYDWWISKYKQYGWKTSIGDRVDANFQPMLLEVRDDDWDDEKIEMYLKFLQHMIDVRFSMCDYDIDKFARHLFYHSEHNGLKYPGDLPKTICYDPIEPTICPAPRDYEDRISCSMQGMLFVRLGDLSLPICHRTCYDHMLGGRFVVKDDQIVGVEGINVTAYISAKTFKPAFSTKCLTCHIRDLCSKGCLGAQFEANGDYMIPCDSVCRLKKAQQGYLFKVYCESGVLASAIKQDVIEPKEKEIILKYCDVMGYKYE